MSPRATEGIVFEPLSEGGDEARRLFGYAGAWTPPALPGEVGWGAWINDPGDTHRLIGAILLERKGAIGMLHGPVVVVGRGAFDPLEVAARLLADLLLRATGQGVETLFARPQGLDRVWVRFGFIPVPEADLPAAFRSRPGTGLFAWRGGTALWSSRKPQTDEGPH
ncbi:MAG: hypothetical protein HY725_11660 [Candidatus Rokubacteria bacterium]|nr:hypothetical protein [Candidatus Rokubacteria bacterium]